MKKLISLTLIMFLLLAAGYGLRAAEAAVPHLINYQGKLTDASGSPLNGAYTITFKIYDAESGPGTMTPWEEAYDNLNIQKGIFSVMLGSVKDLNLPFDKPYFLEIKIKDPRTGSEEVMDPRQQITSAGYAYMAARAEKADEIRGSDNIFPGSGNVGIGTARPEAKLEIAGQIKITGANPGAGKVLSSDAAGLSSWQPASTIIISGNSSLMDLPAGGSYTVLCWATYYTCEDHKTTLRLDGGDKKSYDGAGNDSQGCDQNTIMVRLTGVASGGHTWSLYKTSGGIGQQDYMWMAFGE